MSRSPYAPAGAERFPAGAPAQPTDPFLAARAGYWKQVADGPAAWRASEPQLLADLVRAEYGAEYGDEYGADSARRGRPTVATPGDLALARLRRRLRAGRIPPPQECVRLLTGCDHTAAAVFDVWPDVVRRHGPRPSTSALRDGLREPCSPRTTTLALDLAAATGLRPLHPHELLVLCAAGEREIRHAAWRLLSTYGTTLPACVAADDAEDAYERLLAEASRSASPHPGADAVGLRPGMLIAQSMLMGHLDRPGEGLSGGLSVLLGSLGDALARTDHVAGVLTVVTACVPELEADPVLLRRRDHGHWVLRIPVDSPHPVRTEEMGRHREAMAWWATRLFTSIGRPIDVLHVRYADDGSLALAQAARRAGPGLVFTATPDPHRQVSERHDVAHPDTDALRQDLHRVFIADRLVERADRVVGIAGRGQGAAELLRHFPQLAARGRAGVLGAPPEGIAPYRPPASRSRRSEPLLGTIGALAAAHPVDRPAVLLSVGRLHPVKQQDLLVRAWIASGCHQESILVIVGGSPTTTDPLERAMRGRIEQAVASCDEARGRLLLLPALSNADVRTLERSLAGTSHRFRARYVCPSAKEEFGLAVLEAMEAGLLAAAPIRGGVPGYLVDGHNGILMDTSSASTLGDGLRRLIRIDDSDAGRMSGHAQHLVRSTYSSTAMAQALAHHYTAVTRRKRGSAVVSPPRL
ncbi:glycosyltransferase family 4 protein [Streptomyces sp. CB02009]|uniref:glycosyltransferase family 4 protein n=1 Tax=Streptomyces sp. CB02009 TaxID=1703938 RepID=UPI00093CD1E3|nr:glycosyltransferase family 4 protein [Streptomyces sp. CB02009]